MGVDIIIAPLIYETELAKPNSSEKNTLVCDVCEIVYKSFVSRQYKITPLPEEFKNFAKIDFLKWKDDNIFDVFSYYSDDTISSARKREYSSERNPTRYFGYSPVRKIDALMIINKRTKAHKKDKQNQMSVDHIKKNIELPKMKKIKMDHFPQSNVKSEERSSTIDTNNMMKIYNNELSQKKKFLKQIHSMLIKCKQPTKCN